MEGEEGKAGRERFKKMKKGSGENGEREEKRRRKKELHHLLVSLLAVRDEGRAAVVYSLVKLRAIGEQQLHNFFVSVLAACQDGGVCRLRCRPGPHSRPFDPQ